MNTWLEATSSNATILEGFHQGKVHVLEIHTYPTFHSIVGQLQTWKHEMSHRLKIPVFAFAMVREPVSFQISSFNYLCLGRLTNPRKHCRGVSLDPHNPGVPTAEHLLAFHRPNNQCSFLSEGWVDPSQRGWRLNKKSPSEEKCMSVFQNLYTYMDWIGVTSQMNETLEVLDRVLPLASTTTTTTTNGSSSTSQKMFSQLFTSENVSSEKLKNPLSLKQLNSTVLDRLKLDNAIDANMVDYVTSRYRLESVSVVGDN